MRTPGSGDDDLRSWASVVTALILLFILFVDPLIIGNGELDPDLLLQGWVAVVLTWTAVFAAGNLQELRAARFAEIEPLLDVSLTGILPRRKHPELVLENLGGGPAKELKITMWLPEPDEAGAWRSFAWTPAQLGQGTVPAGEEMRLPAPVDRSRIAAAHTVASALGVEFAAEVVFELRYKTVTGERRMKIAGFRRRRDDSGTFLETLHADDLPPLTQDGRAERIKGRLLAHPAMDGLTASVDVLGGEVRLTAHTPGSATEAPKIHPMVVRSDLSSASIAEEFVRRVEAWRAAEEE